MLRFGVEGFRVEGGPQALGIRDEDSGLNFRAERLRVEGPWVWVC